MQADNFKREFRQLNGVYIDPPSVVLFRRPLELYDLENGETIATFRDLDEALAYELDGKTLLQLITGWESITFPRDGGRGGGSGLSTFKFDHARGSGSGDNERRDLPARLNVLMGAERSPDAALKAFRDAHVDDRYEHGVAVDEHGYVTRYVHGDATSVGIWGGKDYDDAVGKWLTRNQKKYGYTYRFQKA